MPKLNDISGKQYGRLIAKTPIKRGHGIIWECSCTCGKTSYASSYDLEHGKVRSCGCLAVELREEKFRSLIGKKFGRLLVLDVGERTTSGNKSKVRMKCRCDCGAIVNVRPESLKGGKTVSCGCFNKEQFVARNTKHGLHKSRLYRIWAVMRQRCNNPNDGDNYKNYGGRGIKVCQEWEESFTAFYEWAMSHGYSDELSIDRIDVNGNYEPSNCRWATPREQANNTRMNRNITHKGETKSVSEWARCLGISKATLESRLRKGMSPEEAIETPIKEKEWHITYDGRTMKLADWSKETGISRHAISSRIKSGWAVELALTTPSRVTKRRKATKEPVSNTQ